MTEARDHAVETTERAHHKAAEVLADLVSVASAAKVYSEPVAAGERTVITAAEVHTGMGFGYGLGSGMGGRGWRRGEEGARSGGGGGGQAMGRPVAVVTIDPDGVHVQPVLDRTKILLTALTALGAIGLALILRRG